MANIVTRSGKGSELSFAEVDSNFTGLASDTAALFARVYTPVANIGAIPASPGNGDRIEISDSTGIRSSLIVQGIPSDFPSSGDISGLQVRLQYSSSLSAWQWVSYESKAPDARYAPLLIMPPGMIVPFAGSSAPSGWLKANGAIVTNGAGTVQGVTANFAALYAVLGSTYGSAGQLPDLRGEFIRGWDDGRGVDTSRAIGTAQSDDFKSHTHNYSTTGASGSSLTGGASNIYDGVRTLATSAAPATGGTETRPRNIALLYCIKY